MKEFEYLSYELKDDIHIVTYKQIRTKTVDEFIEVFRYICETYKPDDVIKLAVDSQLGTLSVRYMMREINKAVKEYPVRPEFDIAIIVEDSLVYRMLNLTLRALIHDDNLKLFTDLDTALQWLKEQ